MFCEIKPDKILVLKIHKSKIGDLLFNNEVLKNCCLLYINTTMGNKIHSTTTTKDCRLN